MDDGCRFGAAGKQLPNESPHTFTSVKIIGDRDAGVMVGEKVPATRNNRRKCTTIQNKSDKKIKVHDFKGKRVDILNVPVQTLVTGCVRVE